MGCGAQHWRMHGVGTASFAAVVLSLALAAGCGHQEPLQAASGKSDIAGQPPPFGAGRNGIAPVGRLVPGSVPSGTLITIRLQNSISSAAAHAGDSFAASLDGPIVVDGQTVVPDGALVTGRVIASARSARPQDVGYLRLTLTTIEIDGSAVPIQSSSIFARGSRDKPSLAAARDTGLPRAETTKDAGFPADRRLTFRLAEPLPLGG